MLDWDKRIKADRVGARLKALGPHSWVSFAAGSLEHAYRVVRVRESWKRGKTAAGNHVEHALKHAWQFVGTGRTSVSLEKEVDKIHVDAPNEDDPGVPGEGDLLSGAMDLLDLIGRPSADAARDLASQGYQAVMDTAIPDVAGGEATVLAAERASPSVRPRLIFSLPTWLRSKAGSADVALVLDRVENARKLIGFVPAEVERLVNFRELVAAGQARDHTKQKRGVVVRPTIKIGKPVSKLLNEIPDCLARHQSNPSPAALSKRVSRWMYPRRVSTDSR